MSNPANVPSNQAQDRPSLSLVGGSGKGTPAGGNPQRQLESLRQVQAQAEQRVQLGMQLFKAAEARVASQQAMIEAVRAEQDRLREQMHEDVTRSLHAYDQWVGQIDENFTHAIRALEHKVEAMQRQWQQTQGKVEGMMKRAEALLDQSRVMVADSAAKLGPAAPAAAKPAPAAAKAAPAAPPVDAAKATTSEQVSEVEMDLYRKLLRRMHDEQDRGASERAA